MGLTRVCGPGLLLTGPKVSGKLLVCPSHCAPFQINVSMTFTSPPRTTSNDSLYLSFIICKTGGTGEEITLLSARAKCPSLPALNSTHLI